MTLPDRKPYTDNPDINEQFEQVMSNRLDQLADDANARRLARGEEPLEVNE